MPETKASRGNRLQQTITAASWWLMGQGLLYYLMGDRLSGLLRLRYQDNMAPYICLSGLALLCLGLFINRAVREASRQYLAVDTLLLFFIGLCLFTLHQKLLREDIFWFEWLSLAVNFGLGTALVLYRTRGSEMQAAPGTLVAYDALEAIKQAEAWFKGRRSPAKPRPVEVEAAIVENPLPEAAAPVEPPPAAPAPEAPRPKPSSEAMPHMD